MTTPPRASLLGLLRELRLAIYDIVTTHSVYYDLNSVHRTTTTPNLPSSQNQSQRPAPARQGPNHKPPTSP